MTAVIAVTSGKAQAGKSVLSANLAQYLNQKGHRTGLLAAGAGQPVWGIEPSSTWPDILGGRLPIDRAIHRDVFGIDLMVTQGHRKALQGISTQTACCLEDPTGLLDGYAYVIVDLTAELSGPALACCLAATETIMVLTPDTPTLSASYEWLMHLARHDFTGPVNLILNKVRKPALVQSIYLRFKDLTQKRLKIQSNLWGSMSMEEKFDPSVARQVPLSQTMPHSKLLRDIHVIGDRLVAEQPPENQTRPLKDFWKQFIDCLQPLPGLPAVPAEQSTDSIRRPQERIEQIQEAATLIQEPLESEIHVQAPTASPENGPSIADAQRLEAGSQAVALLSAQLTAIAQELSAIRRLLETRPIGDASDRLGRKSPAVDSMDFDFDAFVSQHQKIEEK